MGRFPAELKWVTCSTREYFRQGGSSGLVHRVSHIMVLFARIRSLAGTRHYPKDSTRAMRSIPGCDEALPNHAIHNATCSDSTPR